MNWRRWRRVVSVAVALGLGLVLLLPQSEVHAGTPDDSYTIERYYSENATEQTNTSTDFHDAVTLTFTPPSTKNFLVLASAALASSSTSSVIEAQFLINGATYGISQYQPGGDAITNYLSFGSAKVISLSGGIAHTIKIQFRVRDTLGTAKIKTARIVALEVTNQRTAEAEVETNTNSTTYVNKVTLTFTPPVQADYLIIASADMANAGVKLAYAQLAYGAVQQAEMPRQTVSVMQYTTFNVIRKLNLTAVSRTFTIDYKTENASAGREAYMKNARIVAVPLSDLTGTPQYAESEAGSSTQSTTYVDKTTLTFTPSAQGDYLVIMSASMQQDSTSYAVYVNLYIDATSYGEWILRPNNVSAYVSDYAVTKVNLAAASHTLKIQWRTNNAQATSQAFIRNARLSALRIDTAESYNDSPHTTVDNNFTSPENTVYIWAHGLQASTSYKVAYYDGNATGGGQYVATDSPLTSTAYGNLSSQSLLTTDPNAVAGTWHAVVFYASATPPTNYNDAAATTGYVVADSFTVDASAIPEFPTVMAGIIVAGICFGIYYWMRKRKMAYVKA